LYLAACHGSVFEIEPDAIEPVVGRMSNVRRDEEPHGAHADQTTGAQLGECFASTHENSATDYL
jgi:hypothetical protein